MICPECKGKGYFERIISQYWEEEVITETVQCLLCHGNKEIDELLYAIYKAREGMPAQEIRGFG